MDNQADQAKTIKKQTQGKKKNSERGQEGVTAPFAGPIREAEFFNADNENLSQIETAFLKAREAQKRWQMTSFAERRSYLEKMRHYILKNVDNIVDRMVECTGKTRVDALADEVLPVAFACQWYGKQAEKILAPQMLTTSVAVLKNKRSLVARIPLGVVGIISPWNYPLSIPFGEILMALMSGNAVMLKGSPQSLGVSELIEKIVASSGLPEGLFFNVRGPGSLVADAFFAHGIDKIFFTGSVATGKELMRKAAATLTPVVLELGGNDPMIVCEDADIDRAVNGAAWGGYQNAGQTCAGVERVYVHESIFQPFVDKLARLTKSLRHGKDVDYEVDVGAMITSEQYKKVTAHVNDAVKQGAKIIAQSQGKHAQEGRHFPATLLVGVDHSMDVMKEETFGPVLAVMPFKTEDEAIALANDSCYALTSSVWTRDLSRGKRLAMKIEAGVTAINDHLMTHALSETPWGGWKNSGIGRTHGRQGFEEMTHTKVMSWDLLPNKRNIYWYPFDRATYDGLKAALELSFPSNPVSFIKHASCFIPFALKKNVHFWSALSNSWRSSSFLSEVRTG